MVYFGKNRFHCNQVDSTNEELKRYFLVKDLENGSLLTSDFQTRGKGQMGSSWESSSGKNFLGTFFLKSSIPLRDIFVLNMIVSLSIIETLNEFIERTIEIKWPNDIVVNRKKIAGILIENKYRGGSVTESFLGIGLNLNQKIFKRFQRPATSLIKEVESPVSIEAIVTRICFHLQQFYSLYELKGYETISFLYHKELYLKGEEYAYKVGKDTRYLTLQSVSKRGDLQMFNQFGNIEQFGLKEISFLS